MTLVLCNGVFDLLHIGHIRHLEEARKLGDYLVVAVTMDEYVGKGKGRPIETLDERMEKLRALRIVSAVSASKSGLDALQHWRPNVFCKGIDYSYKGIILEEERFCRENKIKVIYTKAEKHSTGDIIERIKRCA